MIRQGKEAMDKFDRPLRIEQAYERAIELLLNRLFKLPDVSTLTELLASLSTYKNAVVAIEGFATQLASKMVTQVAFQNAQSWREAARQSSKGSVIYNMLRNEMKGELGDRLHFIIKQNAQLIKTVPLNVAERTTRFVQQEQMKGRRSEDIMRDIKPYMNGLKDWQVTRIARTEVAKADTAITRTRAEAINLNWYVWATSHDARVRDSHRIMDTVLVNWSDPPSPEALARMRDRGHYHAGDIYNCRCIALPLVTLSDVVWPSKVYHFGRIQRMSQRQFMKISGLPLHIAA